MRGNSNPTLAGDRLKETAISPARPVVDDCGHPDYGCDSRGPWSRRHVCGYRRAALVLSTVYLECSAEPRLVGAGGTLANLIFGAPFWVVARAVTAVGIWALLLLAAYDLQFVRGRRIFPVLRYRRHRLGCDRGEMAARVGMARRLDCARNATYFFLWVLLCAWKTCASDQKSQRSSTQPERNKLPMQPQPRPETNGDSHQSSDS
jgi:hypothetical protein